MPRTSRARRSGSSSSSNTGFEGSYSSVKRFLRRVAPPAPRATLPLEVDPGEAQVDFGFGGPYRESDRLRRAWAFVMTLSCSRHQYAELAFDQRLATWLRLHRTAFSSPPVGRGRPSTKARSSRAASSMAPFSKPIFATRSTSSASWP